jgi:rod shape-determining protein MreC
VSALRSRAVAILVILVLILVWLILDQAKVPNPVKDTFSRIVTPVQFVLQRLTSPLASAMSWATHLGTLQSENDAQRQAIVELRNQIMLLQEAQIENETLRRQLSFKSTVPNYRLLSAEVIGHDPSNLLQYLIIDRGASDGIQRGMPVITAEGLVGRISETSAESAQVMLITDPSSSVSALIQRSRATGVVQGYPGQALVMRYIPQGDTVALGDVVLTSGLGGNFPKRLVIGQVASVSRKDVEMFQEAEIIPAVNLHDLETVMVVLSFTPLDLAQESVPK